MTDDTLARARRFHDDDFDPTTRAELEGLIAKVEAGDEAARLDLEDRFRGSLEFGTAGLRGLVGAGENRMNRAVVVRTSAGLATHLLRAFPDAKTRGVVIGRDGRHGSPEFLEETAAVLAAAGIKARVFEGVVPTPLVSFAVRATGAAAGVMVTASHNPPEYNGYKVYWENAAQIIPPHDVDIAAAIAEIGPARSVPRLGVTEGRKTGLIVTIGAEVENAYYDAIVACSRRNEGRENLSIVYTPMHGVGDRFVHDVFKRFGFPKIVSVPEQAEPDGAFPTVRFPNPEEPGAMDLSLALARKQGADLVLANDPDADRLAVAVPTTDDPKGAWTQLTGNEIGIILAHYLLTDDPKPQKDRLVLTTIVSSPLLSIIARELGVRYEETLTGFKWIANRAMALEAETGTTMIMGFEEALGYTVGTVARDKDGVGAAAIFAEMTASLKSRGTTVLARLEAIYRRFGLVVSKQHNVTRKGADGAASIRAEMAAARKAPPTSIAGEAVAFFNDYQTQERTELATKKKTKLSLPPSDVLSFELTSGSRVTMRPSGTEPKIKYYFDIREQVSESEPFAEGRARANARLAEVEKAFVAFATALTH